MHPVTQYSVCPCLFDLHFTDGTYLAGVYLAKLPGDNHYSLAIKVIPGVLQVLDIRDDEIIAAVDPRKVQFEY